MCGICGIVRLDGERVDPGELDELTDALAHRGPDGRGTWIKDNVGLGHRRLRIIDLSEAGAQPMRTPDGRFTITFNGEIYNYQALRKELEAKGVTFHSRSDTEVLLQLFAREGNSSFQKLRGQFAFAVYDAQTETLTLVRDRVGKKPVKYFFKYGTFAFASELKALKTLAHCPHKADDIAMHHFLTMMYVPSPDTGIEGVRKLPAGHMMMLNCKTGEQRIERYWKLQYTPDTGPSVDEWKERILATLEESVRLRMIADVPVGAFLSGGVDSAAVVALMQRLSPQPVKTFTIGSEDPQYDESDDALAIAKRFGTDHRTIHAALDFDLFPELVRTYEEPFADPSIFPTWLVARGTRQHVTVALNGDGGDECFLGYVRYPILRFSQRWHWMGAPIHPFVRGATSVFHFLRRNTFSYLAKRFQAGIGKPWPERYLDYLSFFTDKEKEALERPELRRRYAYTSHWYGSRTEDARDRAKDLLHKAASMDIDTYLADDLMPKVDLGTMAHALEARSPFLDHTMLELAATIPVKHKIRGKTRKWILRETLKGILPAEHLAKKKRGFRVPLNRWFRGELKEKVRASILDGSPTMWAMLDKHAVEKYLDLYHRERVDRSDHVWALLWLAEWTRQYTDL